MATVLTHGIHLRANMTRRRFSRELKIEAVKPVTERAVSGARACGDLELAESVLRRWMQEAAGTPTSAFQTTVGSAELAEIAALKIWVVELKAAPDIRKKSAAFFARTAR